MKKTLIGKGKYLMEFEDILDFVEYAEGGPSGRHSMTYPKRPGFCDGTWEDAVTQARTGNSDLVKSLFDGVNVLNAMIEQEKVGEIRDVTGEYFDVADFLSGEPEVFRREEFGDKRQVVPVYANFTMHCDISPKIIRNRGCGIVALCDELSKSGFIVDLRLVESCEGGGFACFTGNYYTSIKVGLDPLDLDTAAFIIANPLCLRRIWFAVIERATDNMQCGGYGTPIEYDLSDVFESGLSGFYFTSSNHCVFSESNYSSLEATKEHILKMIEKFKESSEQVVLG